MTITLKLGHNDDDIRVVDISISIACFHPFFPSSCSLVWDGIKKKLGKTLSFLSKVFSHLLKCCFSEGAPAFTASSMNEVDSADAWIYQFGETTNLFITYKSEFISTLGLFYISLQNSSMNCSWRKSQSLMCVCSVTVVQSASLRQNNPRLGFSVKYFS